MVSDACLWGSRGVVKERRAVQYGVVDASDVDVAAGAPGFSAVFQSKEDLRGKLMECSDVPKDARLYFWNGKLWIRWGNSQDLPGPDRDPLRIKASTVKQPPSGSALCMSCLYHNPVPPVHSFTCMYETDLCSPSSVAVKVWPLLRNGMLWSQPIENAYEDSRICFAFDPEDGEYRLHVLDNALLDLTFADPFPHHSTPKPPLHADKFEAISWRDVHGKCIQFGASCTRPFERELTLHACLAWDVQLDRQCLPDSFDARGILTSRWSCDDEGSADLEVTRWLTSAMPNASRSVTEVDSEVDLEEDDASGVSS